MPQGLEALHVLGDYWRPDEPIRTELGELIHAAKDHHQVDAADQLAEMITNLVPGRLDGLAEPVLVGAVPSNPVPSLHLPSVLAEALAATGVGIWSPDLVSRGRRTPRLRDVDPEHRPDVARAAGYRAGPLESGTTVVLVDDVVLTGTTLSHLAGCLLESGASRVVGAVAARTRRR